MRKNNKDIKKKTNEFGFWRYYSFFGKYSLGGILLIMLSIIAEYKFKNSFLCELFVRLLSSIGIALLIGAIFDFSKNSQAFTDFVSGILKDIIINRSFFGDLELNSKKQALEMILSPSENQIEQYSEMNPYFQKKIKEAMDMFNTNFKSNLVLFVEVKKENGYVVALTELTYNIYKVENEYEPIRTSFEMEDSKVISTQILYPHGCLNVEEKDVRSEDETVNSRKIFYEYNIPKNLYEYHSLTVKKKVIEKGYDHWANVCWTTLTPCDGINYKLRCLDGLTIKQFQIFDDVELYDIEMSEDKSSVSVFSSSWLNKFTGFSIIVSDT